MNVVFPLFQSDVNCLVNNYSNTSLDKHAIIILM